MAAAANLPEQLEASLCSLVPVDGCLACSNYASELPRAQEGKPLSPLSPQSRGFVEAVCCVPVIEAYAETRVLSPRCFLLPSLVDAYMEISGEIRKRK